MDRKHLIALAVILALLIAGVYFRDLLGKNDTAVTDGVSSRVMASFDAGRASLIAIGKGSGAASVELFRENGTWKVKKLWNAKADPAKVGALLAALPALRGDLRGSDKALFRDFAITDDEAFFIKVADDAGAPLFDLRVGNRSAGPGSYFMREGGEADVFFTDTPFDRLLGLFTALEEAMPANEFWADLSLLSVDPDKVTRITVGRVKNDVTTLMASVSRSAAGSSDWKLSGPKESLPADPGKILGFIATMNSIRAQKVENPRNRSLGLENPVWKLTVTQDGKETALLAGPKDAKDYVYFLKRADSPEVYRLNGYYFEDLNVTNDKFVKGPAEEKENAAS
jgi:hypothetical protein